ncbi:MAG TPA: hypothetical protein VFU47_16770 [Armatimonadota bacterium]|nr:hypothetical protein [Armatimonadota bacterium]
MTAPERLQAAVPGAWVEVRFGSFGTQPAVIQRLLPGGRYLVRKYRARTGRWTKPVTINAADIHRVTHPVTVRTRREEE